MSRLAPVFALFLSLIVALSSVSMAAMGHGAGGGTMLVELCGSDIPVEVEIPGAPQDKAPHLCPDCLLHLGAAPLPQASVCHPPETTPAALAVLVAPAFAGPVPAVTPSARAPPFLI